MVGIAVEPSPCSFAYVPLQLTRGQHPGRFTPDTTPCLRSFSMQWKQALFFCHGRFMGSMNLRAASDFRSRFLPVSRNPAGNRRPLYFTNGFLSSWPIAGCPVESLHFPLLPTRRTLTSLWMATVGRTSKVESMDGRTEE